MPNLTAHMDIALECVTLLPVPVLQHNMGAFLLGSCSPDVRIVTHTHRSNTHFAPITNDILGLGMTNMFQTYPALADWVNLPQKTQAFVAGYISHLITDEAWIIKMYQPYFGNRSVFEDEMLANIADRAVQLDLDRTAIETHHGFQHVTSMLTDAHQGIEIEFIDAAVLAEFQQRVQDATQRQFSWERLVFMARRQYPEYNDVAESKAKTFLDDLPDSLNDVYQRIPVSAVADFRTTILEFWLEAMKEYLP